MLMGFWAFVDKATGELVGGALLKPLPDDSDVGVGYHLGKKWWGRGLATEIAAALVRYSFEKVGLKRIVGVTYPENVASRRVLEKAGLVHSGQSRYVDIPVEFYVMDRETWVKQPI
jgi:[ribosomal protein S5]-alanine N-acetyltransferase